MSTKTILSILLLAAASLFAQPNVRDVRSAASDLNPALPGYGIAPGSLIFIAGSTSSAPQAAAFPLTANINGVSAQINVGAQQVAALMVAVTSSGILALAPSQTPTGTGTVQVTDANGTGALLPITVVSDNFGIFSQKGTANSSGAAYALNMNSGGNVWNSLTTPAMPGQQVTILGTGAGATSQDETNPVNAEMQSGNFQLYIGGQLAAVTSTGRSGLGIDALGLPAGLAGVDSIVATVPAGVSGCRVSVVAVTENAYVSNFSTIAVSGDGTTCSDPGYITSDQINGLPASGTYSVGVISMSRFSLTISSGTPLGNLSLNSDTASASFQRMDVNDFRASLGGGNFTSIGGCMVTFSSRDLSNLDNAAASMPLDAGPAIHLKGPKATVVMNQTGTGLYASVTASGSSSPLIPSQGTPFADAGAFAADNGAGGADVQGFVANLNNPQPFTWTNQSQIGDINRTQGVNVTWTGGDPNSTVIIGGSSSGIGGVSATFVCSAPASAGAFLVPPPVTLALPGSMSSGPSTIPGAPSGGGALLVLASTYVPFTAPGLDQAIFTSAGGSIKTLNYK